MDHCDSNNEAYGGHFWRWPAERNCQTLPSRVLRVHLSSDLSQVVICGQFAQSDSDSNVQVSIQTASLPMSDWVGVQGSHLAWIGDVVFEWTVAASDTDSGSDDQWMQALGEYKLSWAPLKMAFVQLSGLEQSAVSFAVQRATWLQKHRFCYECGGSLIESDDGEDWLHKRCSQCGLSVYPSVSPCVIVGLLGPRGLLLARAHHYPEGRYSNIAGFVDPGESAEEAVRREVLEEVGVHVNQLRYLGSQSWPFPRQLMLGYLGVVADECVDRPLEPQVSELADAGWFKPDALPLLPPHGTLSRHLIDVSVAEWRERFG